MSFEPELIRLLAMMKKERRVVAWLKIGCLARFEIVAHFTQIFGLEVRPTSRKEMRSACFRWAVGGRKSLILIVTKARLGTR